MLIYIFDFLQIIQRRNLSTDAQKLLPERWLSWKITEAEESYNLTLHLPRKPDGTPYDLDGLKKGQREIVAEVFMKIREWIESIDFNHFKPLRMIVNGAGGTGKSVVINTIVSTIRQIFSCNDVVKVIAPTGTAAFNVNGETFHHLLANKVTKGEYKAGSMGSYKRKLLVKKFKSLLALVIDE